MTNKERFFRALACLEPDRVPYFDWIDDEILLRMARALNLDVPDLLGPSERTAADALRIFDLRFAVWRTLDLDALIVGNTAGETPVPGRPGVLRDRYGVVYQTSPLGEPFIIDGPINHPDDLKTLDVHPRKEDFRGLEYVLAGMPERVTLFMIGDTFKWSWRLLGGMEHLLMGYIDHPDFCLRLARVATDYVIEAMHMAIDCGADAILMDGDLAYNKGSIMSPTQYRTFIRPFYDDICRSVHARGVRIIKHSDGNVWPIFDDMMGSGFDAFNPVEPCCMDLLETKERLRGRACVIGNIDCATLLPFGTKEQVVEAVREAIRRAGPGGGYILSSSNTVHPGCKAENAVAMFLAAREYGAYPISL